MSDAPGRMTLWGIEVFAATAEEGSISAAARRLGASPSAISQQLSSLEAALKTSLLDRSARPVSLTPAGVIFHRRAQTILNEAALARAELARQDLSALTRLRLGVIEDFDAEVTPALLGQLATTLPGCQFLLETGASHWLFDQLEARALDMVISADIGVEADWVEVVPLMRDPFVAVLPKGVVADGEDSLQRLQEIPLIQYTSRQFMGRQIAAHLVRQNLTLAHRYELDSYNAILAMVANGDGWTILTPLGIMQAQRFLPQVDVMPLPFEGLSRDISLFARREILQEIPGQVAALLRPLLRDLVTGPVHRHMPWLEQALAVY